MIQRRDEQPKKNGKGLEDEHACKGGVMYAPGEFFQGVEADSSD